MTQYTRYSVDAETPFTCNFATPADDTPKFPRPTTSCADSNFLFEDRTAAQNTNALSSLAMCTTTPIEEVLGWSTMLDILGARRLKAVVEMLKLLLGSALGCDDGCLLGWALGCPEGREKGCTLGALFG